MRYMLAALLLLIARPAPAQLVEGHDKFDDTFRKYTKRFFGPGYDWKHFKAQGLAESNLRPDARSYVGARGVMQIMPGTYSDLRKKDTSPENRGRRGVEHRCGHYVRSSPLGKLG